MSTFFTIDWRDNAAVILDQRLLPGEEIYLTLKNVEAVADAIRTLAIRGAPAIGVAGAMGMALAALACTSKNRNHLLAELEQSYAMLLATRPTAVNLKWGLDRMLATLKNNSSEDVLQLQECLVQEARLIRDEDIALNKKMGLCGAALLQDGDTVLTHCNAGALATAGFGTALGVIYAAQQQGKRIKVIADETRPVLQGARLTAWELMQNGIDVTLITDNMAAALMQAGHIQRIIVGADRIAANGDVANKIGTYGVAVLAAYHKIPFYVAAPLSTFDFECPHGSKIQIENRDPEEVTHLAQKRIAPLEVKVHNPAFDVTPAKLVTAIITEQGVVESPDVDKLLKWKNSYGQKS